MIYVWVLLWMICFCKRMIVCPGLFWVVVFSVKIVVCMCDRVGLLSWLILKFLEIRCDWIVMICLLFGRFVRCL